MSSEVSLDDESSVLEFIQSLLVEWEGREIDLTRLDSETTHRVQNLFEYLITESENSDEISAYLARAGTAPQDRSLLQRDIEQLICTPDGVQSVGFKKTCSKIWHKHKKAIIIGAVVFAVVTSVIVVSVCTSGTGAAAAGAAGAAAINSARKSQNKEPPPVNQIPKEPTRPDAASIALPETQVTHSLPDFKPSSPSIPSFQFEPTPAPGRAIEPLVEQSPKSSFFDFLDPKYNEKIPYPLPIAPASTLEKFFQSDQTQDLLPSPLSTVETPISSAVAEWERNLAREHQRLEQERTAVLINRVPEIKKTETYASLAYNGNFTKEFKAQPPFQEMPLIGAAHQSTVHYHCGIANDATDVLDGGHCVYNSLNKQFAVHSHHIHPKNLIFGLDKVFIQKLDEKMRDPLVDTIFSGGIITKIPEILLKKSIIGKSIDYEVENLSFIAQKILERNNPHLKQVHVTFSNGGYIFREALKKLPKEYRDTIIVITTGSTKYIEDNLACKVHNIVGDKDLGSQICNGLNLCLDQKKEMPNIFVIPQREVMAFPLGGHYFMQADYQDEIKRYINNEVVDAYEIY